MRGLNAQMYYFAIFALEVSKIHMYPSNHVCMFLHTYMCIYMCFVYYIYRFCIFILGFLSNIEYCFVCF